MQRWLPNSPCFADLGEAPVSTLPSLASPKVTPMAHMFVLKVAINPVIPEIPFNIHDLPIWGCQEQLCCHPEDG